MALSHVPPISTVIDSSVLRRPAAHAWARWTDESGRWPLMPRVLLLVGIFLVAASLLLIGYQSTFTYPTTPA
jgi:hypothetical protein